MDVLVVNAGSSSLKLRLLDGGDAVLARGDLPPTQDADLPEALDHFLSGASSEVAVGHRVVHGGADFRGPVLLDDRIEHHLDRLAELAPLHNPPAVAAIRAVQLLRPELAQVACFDTAFHATLPAEAATYALPWRWTHQWGLRRFGFHGLSHAWASRRAAELLGHELSELRLVTAHIGSGASLAAVAGGRSVDTTMGFTPLEGLVMATRPGNLDPGLMLWLQHHGVGLAELEQALEHDSGLAGISGRSPDLRAVLRGMDDGDERCRLAYGVYLHRLRTMIAAMAAAMSGLDGLVFTGGAGEGSARLRRDACAGLGFLGIAIDRGSNERSNGEHPIIDRLVSTTAAPVAVAVVEAREDIEIARQVREVLRRHRI